MVKNWILLFCFFSSLTSLCQTTYTSNSSGNWNSNIWTPSKPSGPGAGDNVVIAAGTNVAIGNAASAANLTVQSDGFLTGSKQLTVSGNFQIDGSYSNTSGTTLTGTGTTPTISGAGGVTVGSTTFDITGDYSISSGAAITFSNTADITIASGKTVTNNGTVTVTGNISGTGAWTNASSSYLYIGGTLLTSGTLDASASDNTINFYDDADQTIKIPSSSTYYNLSITGGGNKTLSGSGTLTVAKNLVISSNLTASGIYTLNVGGSWTNTGTFDETKITTVVFNSGDGTLSSTEASGETFANLTIDKTSTSNALTVSSNVIVSGVFTMTKGNIITGSNKITLGTSTSSAGTWGTYTSGNIIGKFERWVNATATAYLFPVGATGGASPLTITFANGHLTNGSLIVSFVSSYPGITGFNLTENGKTFYNTFTEGYWSISANNGLASTSYDIHLTASWFSSFASNTNNSRIATRGSSSSAWVLDGNNSSGSGILDIGRTSVGGSPNSFGANTQFCFASDYQCTTPSPSLAINNGGVTTVCQATTTSYTLNNAGAGTGPFSYSWSVTGGHVTTGVGTNSVSILWDAVGGNRTISVVETNSCTNGPTATLAVKVESVPPSSMTGLVYAPQNSSTAVTYSIASDANYNSAYTYSWDASTGTSPGTITSSSSGVGLSSVSIKWGAAGTGQVKVTASNGTCGSSSYSYPVNVYKTIKSISNKNWNNSQAWDCSCIPSTTDNVEIMPGYTVTLNSAQTINSLVVNSGAAVTATSNSLTIKGELLIYGSITGTTGSITLDGSSTASSPVVIAVSDGSTTGIYTTTTGSLIFSNAYSVASGSSFTKSGGPIQLASGVTLTNNGAVTISGDLSGNSSTSQWTNAAGSSLTISGALLTTGVLDASASTNTVTYSGTTNQTLKTPKTSYNNLAFTGTTPGTTGSIVKPSSSGLTTQVTGNWNNSASGTTATGYQGFDPNGGTINFNGTSAISGTTTTTFNNITISNGATVTAPSAMNVQGNISVSGTFTHNSGTIILTGTSAQTISGTNASTTNFNSITINSSAILSAPSTLNIQGNLTNNNGGVSGFVHNSGTVAFSPASSPSQIAGNSKFIFYNVSVTNGSAGTDLILENTAGADLTNVLNVGAATFDIDGGGLNVDGGRVFTLLSTSDNPTADASIAPIVNGEVNGKVTVQRYLKYAGNPTYYNSGWRDISSPVNTTVSDLKATLPITGTFNDPSNVTINGTTDPDVDNSIPSMVYYNEAVITDTSVPADDINDLNDGFVNFPPNGSSTTSTSFTMGRGYSVYIFGSDDPFFSSNHATYSLRGPLWSPAGATIDLPITISPSGNNGTTIVPENDGWNLIGNPYPSAIDWSSTGWTKDANIQDAIWIDDYSGTNPVFVSYVNSIWSKGGYLSFGKGYIASGQSFWVKATGTLGSNPLRITEAVKVNNQTSGFSAPNFFRSAAPRDLVRVALTSSDQLRDETVIYLSDLATDELDIKYDAQKLKNPYGYLNLSSISPAQKDFAINGLPFQNCGQKTVSLNVSDVTDGNYTLSFSDYGAMSSAMSITLKDNYTNSITEVRKNQSYSFAVDLNDAATYGSNRFSVTFAYSGTPTAISLQGIDTCDPTQGKVVVKNSALDFNYSIVSPVDGSVLVSPVQGDGADIEFEVPGTLSNGKNNFTVKATNRFCHSFDVSSSASLDYVVVPGKAAVQSASTCGKGTVVLTASGAPSGGYYQWYDSLSAKTPYPVQTSNFTTDVLLKDKTYFVSMVNKLGCEGERVEVKAKVIIIDPVTITVSDLTTLGSSYTSGNQWYLNGEIILGATSQTLTITQTGRYKVVATSQGCTVSDEKEMVVTEVTGNSGTVKAHPNPVNGVLTIEVDSAETATGEIYNSLGVVVSMLSFNSLGERQVAVHNFAGQASGMYFIKVNQQGKPSVLRVVKE